MSVCVCLWMQKLILLHTHTQVFYHSEKLSVPYAHAGADHRLTETIFYRGGDTAVVELWGYIF